MIFVLRNPFVIHTLSNSDLELQGAKKDLHSFTIKSLLECLDL